MQVARHAAVSRCATAGAAVMPLLAWARWQPLLLVLLTVDPPAFTLPHLARHDRVGQITRAPLEAAQQQHAKLSCEAQHLQGPGTACCAHSMLPVHAARYLSGRPYGSCFTSATVLGASIGPLSACCAWHRWQSVLNLSASFHVGAFDAHACAARTNSPQQPSP